MTRAEHRLQMENRITAFNNSGQSLSAWCRDHEVSYYQMQYWLKKNRNGKTAKTHSTPNWMSVEVNERKQHQPCLPVKIGSVTVEVEPGFDPSLLADVVRALKTC